MSTLALLGGKPIFPRSHRWPAWPIFNNTDRKRLVAALDDRWGVGAKVTDQFIEALKEYTGCKYALPVNSGTAALELIVKSLDIAAGDEVIVPSYTFVASVTSILELGATVVFADIDPLTFNIDPNHVAKLITRRTRAVMVVHFGGNPVDLAAIKRVIAGKNIAIIEDAAHAHGMLYRGKAPGHHGIAAEYSYQSTKNMNCGEGGSLVTNNKQLHDRAWSCHSFGRLPGHPWYEHHLMSWNHRLTAFQSALLLGQLERLEEQTVNRQRNGTLLNHLLAQLPGQYPQRDGDTHAKTRRAYHLYIWRFDERAAGLSRARFLEALAAEGVPGFGGYIMPLQNAPMFQQRRFWHSHGITGRPKQSGEPDYRRVKTPVAANMCKQAVWLSQNILLTNEKTIRAIADAVQKVLENAHKLRA